MKIVSVDPKDRLPNLADREHAIYGYRNMMVNLPRFQCPHCGAFTVFTIDGKDFPPLPPEVIAQFDSLTPSLAAYERGKADFACRECIRPVRVIYRIEEIKCFLYYAESVLETA